MLYEGPHQFRELIEAAFGIALERIPKEFQPDRNIVVSGCLDFLGNYLYGLREEQPNHLLYLKLAALEECNPYRLLGFGFETLDEAEEKYNQKIDTVISEFKETRQLLPCVRSLRRLCGAETLENLAGKMDTALVKLGLTEKHSFSYFKERAFMDLNCGIDTRVWADMEGIAFNPNFLSEVYIPGVMLGGHLPDDVNTKGELTKFLYETLSKRFGVEPSEYVWHRYAYTNSSILVSLMAHGVVHYILMKNTAPYVEIREKFENLSGKKREEVQGTDLEYDLALAQHRLKNLDCDLAIEAVANVVSPGGPPCFGLEGRLDKLCKVKEILRVKPKAVPIIGEIINHAWRNDENTLNLLQEA